MKRSFIWFVLLMPLFDGAEVSKTMLVVEAVNLSEDMNRFATINDEIYLFIYNDYLDGTKLPVLMMESVFDQVNRKDSILFEVDKTVLYTMVIIEEDSDRSLTEVEKLVRTNRDSLQVYFRNTQYKKIEKILGSDDVLYIGELQSDTTIVEGIHKVDRYKYLISFEPSN